MGSTFVLLSFVTNISHLSSSKYSATIRMAFYLPSPCPSEAIHDTSARAPSTELTALGRLEQRHTRKSLQALENKYNRLQVPLVPPFDFYDRLEDAIQRMNSNNKQGAIEQAAEHVGRQLVEENKAVEKKYSRAPYHGHIDANLYNPEYKVGKAFPFCVTLVKDFLSYDLERLLALLQQLKDRKNASRQRRTTPQNLRRSKRLEQRGKIASRQPKPQRMRIGEGLQKRDKKRVCKRKA